MSGLKPIARGTGDNPGAAHRNYVQTEWYHITFGSYETFNMEKISPLCLDS